MLMIDVHVRDMNADRSGASNKECTLGAREKPVRVLNERLAKLRLRDLRLLTLRLREGFDSYERAAVDQGASL